MTTATTPNPLAASVELVLCIAFELGASKWKMAFSTGLGQQPRHREVSARDLAAVQREIDRAKARFGLPAEARVASCYEAGRDGFWIRSIAIEIAWGWLRYQPQSELSRWYERRFGHGSSRLRKIGIVALARKLLVELWNYLETGTPPAGAIMKVGTLKAS
jgi:hypothetical protein